MPSPFTDRPHRLHTVQESDPAREYQRLCDTVAAAGPLIVAYSGGVDSALLAYAAHDVLAEKAVAVTAVSASLSVTERRGARAFAKEHGIAHVEIATDELDREAYARNDGSRCFWCKTALFEAIEPIRALSGAQLALGTNLDDLGEHRPGLAAAREHSVLAPLVDGGLDKEAVRAVSAYLGLRTADKPAQPCLASRVAYGDRVTHELLARIDAAEQAVRSIGIAVVRVRAHADGTVARIEVPSDDVLAVLAHRTEIDDALRLLGFTFCSLDLAGFSSGRLNNLLTAHARS
jgi:pyridinium-3,5-biscarboxylic acid mononucleotide sulfurtransferase